MAASAVAGTVFAWGATTSVANITSIDGPELSVEALDVTAISDTAAQYISNACKDGGELAIELDSDGTVFTVGSTATAKITLASGGTVGFSGIVTSKKFNNEAKGKLTTSIGVKITGAITGVLS